MTLEAKQAVDVAYRLEGKKHGIRQTADGYVNITFSVHPQYVDPRIYADMMGTRYVIVCVPLNDDETPRVDTASPSSDKAVTGEAGGSGSQPKSPRKWDELSYAERAGIRCNEERFQEWSALRLSAFHSMEYHWVASQDNAAQYIKLTCQVSSRADIKPGTHAAQQFEEMELAYDTWLKYERGR